MDRQPKPSKVKNKNPAPVQITAEQILRESKERTENSTKVPQQRIADKEELDNYRATKRKGFEDAIRRNRTAVGNWLKYSAWEESQMEMERARSIYERALDVDHRNQVLWLRYAEMEMKHKNINRARNIFDRAVSILPRIDVFWFKYTYMEELLENVAGARQVFERWMKWEPGEEAWAAYIKMENRYVFGPGYDGYKSQDAELSNTRYNELDRAREIYRRFVGVHPQPKNWLKWAKYEESIGRIDNAREIYQQCIETLGDDFIDQNMYVSFARFETRQKEIERARAIYKFALEKLPKGQTENLYNVYTQFEKQHGAKEGIEDVIIGKRRAKYEDELANNPKNYDIWFDYVRLEETAGEEEKIRELYERAIAQVPPVNEKRFWRRYIYLWIFYAVWEETQAKVAKRLHCTIAHTYGNLDVDPNPLQDSSRTKEVYNQLIKLVPHKTFTFAKIWLLYAKFLIRQKDLLAARKTLGAAIGMCPKEKLFKGYIELELQLREFDRARHLYMKYLEWNAGNCYAWIKFAELEKMLGDVERARGIFEIAVEQPVLDMPEVLWKGFIDFEVGEAEWENARALYERLLQRTEHVKVWITYANFEATALDNGEDISSRMSKAREVFERADKALKRKEDKAERVVLLEAWRELEREHGTAETQKKVVEKMPKPVKKRRRVVDENGEAAGWEEYYDYIFPDDESDRPNFKLLDMAHQWKAKMAAMGAKMGDSDEDDDDDDEEDDEEEGDGDVEMGGNGVGGSSGSRWEKDGDSDEEEGPSRKRLRTEGSSGEEDEDEED
ncbi:Crooked neck-like protein 1 [Rhizophlyctis rosea]|uniref:Crooked neck-like protein 1 n=1 Tax=Rhizophlyctis rosea TaxID=64517 RepID=A0AAD5S907_9FUNG|nr:Crooked neck-like protein 1 [Rhizophlyctis rosea]